MDSNYPEKLTFIGEWYDSEATLTRKFVLHFFPCDNSLDLFDMRQKKTFLRRSVVTGVSIGDLFLGNSVRVFGRLIKIVDYGCEETRRRLSKCVERTFAMIKPKSNDKLGDIIQCVEDKQYKIVQMRLTVLTRESAVQACQRLRDDQDLESILEDVTSGPVLGMELVTDNAVSRWCQDMGHPDAGCVKDGTLRDILTKDGTIDTLYGSTTADDALRDLSYFFPTGKLKFLGPPLTAVFSNCTCCIIKPHAIREGNMGNIIKEITRQRFTITALKMCYLDNSDAAEFFEVYKGVVPDYMGMVAELTSGPCVAMEIVGPANVNTPVDFRKLVGPTDPDLCRQLRPDTIRAKFGKSRIQNAVHCSDLPEDGLLEVEYFFKILQ